MALFSWLFGHKKAPAPPPPPVPIDEQPGFIGDLLRMGEAAGGNAQQAEQEQAIADKPKGP